MNKVPTDDRLWLHLRRWPLQTPAHGVIILVHGLGEHMGRYVMLAQFLNQLGWHVMGCDLRGHGVSEGKRGQVPRGDSFLTDMAQVIDQVREEFPGPLLLLGHSLGGLIAARFVAEAQEKVPALWSRQVDGLVLSSPALDPGMRIGQKLLLATFGRLMPGMSVGNGLKSTWISRERAVVRAYQRDRMVHDRASPRIARFVLDGARVVQARASAWVVPTRCDVERAHAADVGRRRPLCGAARFGHLCQERAA
jgi:alpha-beta hydrolase superfamily lysophospholipase